MSIQNFSHNETTRNSGSKDFEKFVYLLSHDIRSSIRALIEVPLWIEEDLRESNIKIDGSLAENLELMNTHTRRLDRMLVDLLAYSRVGRKQATEVINLDDIMETVLDEVHVPREFNVSVDMHHKEIQIGETDIFKLLSELVTNSIKHSVTGAGNIEVSSRRIGSQCVICVRDDGPGIPLKYRERVFEAMTTLRPRDEVEGSGMGLATVQKIVNLYGGELNWPDGPDCVGTALELRFPILGENPNPNI